MSKPQSLEEFANVLMRTVRDVALTTCGELLAGDGSGPSAARWAKSLQKPSSQAVAELLPDIVDRVIAEWLGALDSGEIRCLRPTQVGELVGSFLGSPGWRNEYSAARFYDDFSELKLVVDWVEEADSDGGRTGA